jgi:hypothetical protein
MAAWLHGCMAAVLSVQTALSIQAHPTKEHGAQLHAAKPAMYPDPNHKPEMTVAITHFEALCGFRPMQQISAFLQSVPELHALVGVDAATHFQSVAASAAAGSVGAAAHATGAAGSSSSDAMKASPWVAGAPLPPAAEKAALQRLFGAVMNADAKAVTSQLTALVKRLEALPPVKPAADAKDVEINALILRLNVRTARHCASPPRAQLSSRLPFALRFAEPRRHAVVCVAFVRAETVPQRRGYLLPVSAECRGAGGWRCDISARQ